MTYSITSSLSGVFPCHCTVEEPFDPLWDDAMDFTKLHNNSRNVLTAREKASSIRLRLPAAAGRAIGSERNVPLPTTQEF